MRRMTTIHIVAHAHLDPIWMWPWTSGLDEAIATARSACDRLDTHPDLFYTQGEAWSFEMIEKADPALFARVRAHVLCGRWEVVNGWWTQPDCNLPSALGLHRQLSTGLAYIKDRFGLAPRCGFNPDSFGHCSQLPEVMRAHGQDRYIFLRPGDHERSLPSRLFTWRSRPDSPAVTAFRIATTYNNGGWIDPFHHALTQLPPGCSHSMVLIGLGNHGGGPTERLISWVHAHQHDLPGVTMRFSTVARFFDAIEAERPQLPTVTGELQFHAVGCYTVMRAVKTAVRRAEHALASAEQLAGAQDQARLDQAWRQVCSHHFHDTLGGTGLPGTYGFVLDELGAAAASAETISQYALRRELSALPDAALPRLVVKNPLAQDLHGWHELEPYLEGRWRGPWRLLDAHDQEVPFQVVESEAIISFDNFWAKRRILLKRSLPAGSLTVLRLSLDQPPAPIPAQVAALGATISTVQGLAVSCAGAGAQLLQDGMVVCMPTLLLIPDGTDTWSHGIDRYGEGGDTPTWAQATIIDRGPLMASLRQEGVLGRSTLCAEWRVFAQERAVELLLEVHWRERDQVLKLVVPWAAGASRTDGVPGGGLERANDGIERPVSEWTRLAGLGIVCPDVFAIDATQTRTRLTLLRSPLMSHHDPHPGAPLRPVYSDQGVHRFRFRFHVGGASAESLAAQAEAWQRPVLVADLTRGMGPRDA